ncbi:hypothetical protein ABZW03_29860 [Kitasatospora sp. NPDC004799]|uniref:hypothetical protein n=1 Tax=Kitasatospora sp. NPDC004799 TaxID=3154460 RepID=UPI0033BC0F62
MSTEAKPRVRIPRGPIEEPPGPYAGHGPAANREVLFLALERCGVKVGEFDRRTIGALAVLGSSTALTVASWLLQSAEGQPD